MAIGARLCFCLLLSFAITSCSARMGEYALVNEIMLATEGRSLMAVRVDDYEEPSANRGHDPPKTRARGGD
ncbi:hypothetical protein CJ030_MR6G003730 [Morella rubra]|uniref:Protein PSY3 n=1 Tax=Morella rubra TaxID=262757 RepID=A0A6A1WM72_9ROSI|nr:hypothetical protein CJ030_MR1G028355 [Morella rubra]KAB1225626.1 hypothetical protein CJ030_MR1G028354 [Morella rubra]KAB1228339.1 hypothetical protein CJ030_MR6G003730 [Morella rubra]